MRIRAVEPADRPAVLAVLSAAFGGEEEALLVARLWAADAIACERLAEAEREVIAYCAFSAVTAAPPAGGALYGLAPVAVAPERQRRGAGSALIRHCLDALAAMGADAVVLVGHQDYYPRFGFRPASERRVRWDARDAGPAFQLLEFRPVFGGEERTISYHPAFAGL